MTNARFAKLLVWINGAVPGAVLLVDAVGGRLGANPVNFAIRTTGLLSLVFLGLSLFITPIRQLLKLDTLIPHRRTLGLYAAFYAFAHFGIFFWFDRERSVSSTLSEIVARTYLWFGAAAVLIFVPLAVTSTSGMIRRLGPGNWKWLHRLVYVAAIAGVVHYMLIGKYVTTQSIVFASVLGVLLIYRLAAGHLALRSAYQKLQKTAATGMTMKPLFWKGRLRVAEVFVETPEVRTFRLVPTNGTAVLPFDYRPGQYLNVSFMVDGRRVNRSYTIASAPTRAGYCEITVKREPAGVASRHLHDMLHRGEEIDVAGPAGKFTFTGTESKHVVLIAAGVGITPLMSKLRYLTDLCWRGSIDLIYIARTENDIIFRDELATIARRHSNVRVTISLTRPSDAWTGECGRLSKELLTRTVADLSDREFHICGPDAMAALSRELLADIGVAPERVKFESFTPPTRGSGESQTAVETADAAAAADASITFARSGQTIDQPGERSVLELAESVGVAVPFDCRSGTCGTCKIGLVSGRVAMEVQDALTATDRAAGQILACQARCLTPVVVDV